MNAIEIIENLPVKLRQFLVQTDNAVALAFAAFFLVRTSAAVLALEILLGSAVFVPSHRLAVNVVELLTIWADRRSVFIDREIYCSVRVISVFFILAFLFKHSEFHELFHALLLFHTFPDK